MKIRRWTLALLGLLVLYGREAQAGQSAPSNVANATTSASSSSGNNAVTEWYGPFSSWSNVKTTYGAVGDGVTDDTAAINNALANVGLGGHSPVLYFPPGTYRVTAKLYLHNRQQVEILGHSPSDTTLKYDGPPGTSFSGTSTLLHLDSIQFVLLARFTLDGNGKSMTLLSCSQSSGSIYFDSANTFEDLVFRNSASGGHGIDGGFYGSGFSNEGFTRCKFIGLAVGLETWNFNALDAWMTDCLFTNCQKAIYVNPGSAHLYHSVLVDNQADFILAPASSYIELVSNVSYRAGTFLQTMNVGANMTPILMKGNTIVDAKTPVVMGQPGPLVMLDNVIACTNGPTVSTSNSLQIDLTAIGNTICTANWISIGGGSGGKTNLVDNFVASRSSLTFAPPVIPPAATNLNRTVVDMPTSITAASLQSAINGAADGTVIHVPWSSNADQQWHMTSTVTLPVNRDMRIVGDGDMTKFSWSGSSGGSMFVCPNPSHVTFSQLQLGGSYGSAGSGIAVTGVGNSASRVYLRDVTFFQGLNANVRLGDCPGTVVDIAGNVICQTSVSPASTGINVLLEGRGKVRMIDTDNGVNRISLVCTNGGQFYGESIYNEAGDSFGNRILQVSGNGTVTYMASVLHENIGSNGDTFERATSNAFSVVNFSGTFLLGLTSYINDWYKVSGSTSGSLMVDGCLTFVSPVGNWPVLNSTGATIVQTKNWNWNNGESRYPDSGSASAAFTRQMYAQARAEYSDRTPMIRRDGLTDVLLEKVYIQGGQNNLWVQP
jgi:Pectate lyase superfamily protein